ncbi:MAG: RDD family protein [Chloroflexota bacterium]|nr:RDD family protein [Chloroflexota bacterium]MDE2959745.1 RDD family protein [Chloroflexota bacterium]
MVQFTSTNAIQRHAVQVERGQIQLTYLDRRRRLIAHLVNSAIAGGWLLAIVMIIWIEPWLLGKCGGTVGHLVVGARVVDHRSGGPISGQQASRRSHLQLLGILIIPVIINFMMVLFRADRRHLYDLWAGTVVVHDPRSFGERWEQANAEDRARRRS